MNIDKEEMYLIWDDDYGLLNIEDVDYVDVDSFKELKNEDWIKNENFKSDIILEYNSFEYVVKVIYDKKYNKDEVMKEIKIVDEILF